MVETVTSVEALEELLEILPEEKAVIETDSGVYVVEVWEGDSAQVFAYLQQVNEQWIEAQQPEMFTTLVDGHKVIFFSKELVEVETEIQTLVEQLNKTSEKETPRPVEAPKKYTIDIRSQRPLAFDRHQMPPLPKEPGMPSSVFSLAGKVYSQERQQAKQPRDLPASSLPQKNAQDDLKALRLKSEKEGGGQGKEEQKKEDQQKDEQKNRFRIGNVKNSEKKAEPTPDETLKGMDDIYIRFMALMARILGQAEAEAHDLYNRIKARTDRIDLLTNLIQKINTSTGGIDWEKDPQMRKMVDEARASGVEIPVGKYSWGEDEKILLKENIQMRKDSLEKITQLERTDMQRFLQEASQCHQARSNILKLLKEVLDTIIYNLRS